MDLLSDHHNNVVKVWFANETASRTHLGNSSNPLDVVDNTIASTNYAQKCREIMDLYRDLRNLGYDILLTFTVLFYHLNCCLRSVHTSFDLPRVVVIGGQSSKRPEIVSYATQAAKALW